MHQFHQRFIKLTEGNEITEEEEEAGIEIFEKYGYFKTLHSLAGGDVTKYETILQTECETIFMTLLFEKDKRKYEKNLREIYERQHQIAQSIKK